MAGHRYHGDPGSLRSETRLALLEVSEVVTRSLAGGSYTTLLDVGTGSGIFAEAFSESGLVVTGIDVRQQMLLAAMGHVPEADFYMALASHLPFAADAFDLVFLGLVLHEVRDPAHALREMRRVAIKRVVVLEWPFRDGITGPPLAHRLDPHSFEILVKEMDFSNRENHSLLHLDLIILDL